MISRYATAFAIVAQMLATVAPCGIVRCVHDDGTSAIEFAGALCCDGDSRQALKTSIDPEERDPQVTSDEDPCTDYALTNQQVRPTSTQESAPTSSPAPAAPLAPHDASAWPSAPKRSERPTQCGPPGNRPPHFRTIILLC